MMIKDTMLIVSFHMIWALVCVAFGFYMGRKTRTDEPLIKIKLPELKKDSPYIDNGGSPFNDAQWDSKGPERIDTIK
ncbi:MAG: hypothetical protein FP816_19660 [Desulfobacteraceae bacterium]|nr:hypothetical protein [Desulfobacteraceae bacterium]